MSVGFGFSVGDFVGAVKLVGTVIDALRENSTISTELGDLYQQLRSLETTLEVVDQLEVDESLHAEMKHLDLGQKMQKDTQKSIDASVQAGFSNYMGKLSTMRSALIGVTALARECLENTRQIIHMNLRVFQVILDVQDYLKSIPEQIERQQPVYLNDALGRYAPFHLEFIRSRAALTYVLSDNFKFFDSTAKKILASEFTIHDSRTKRDVDLDQPWDACFIPGQHVEMSIVLHTPSDTNDSSHRKDRCPRCSSGNVTDLGKDADCANCGLTFRCTTALQSQATPGTITKSYPQQWPPAVRSISDDITQQHASPHDRLENDDEVSKYRRVRFESSARTFGVKLYEDLGDGWIDILTGSLKLQNGGTKDEIDFDKSYVTSFEKVIVGTATGGIYNLVYDRCNRKDDSISQSTAQTSTQVPKMISGQT
ncbi:MAG: hypothetical protein Q9169_007691 [Polycauliona sp. 2 TL-2023]